MPVTPGIMSKFLLQTPYMTSYLTISVVKPSLPLPHEDAARLTWSLASLKISTRRSTLPSVYTSKPLWAFFPINSAKRGLVAARETCIGSIDVQPRSRHVRPLGLQAFKTAPQPAILHCCASPGPCKMPKGVAKTDLCNTARHPLCV